MRASQTQTNSNRLTLNFCKPLIKLASRYSLVLLLLLGVAEGRAKLRVITSFTVLADITQQIAGDRAQVLSITRVGAEVHDYQPRPKDIVKALGVDLILWNGMNLERWYQRFLNDVKGVPSVVVSAGIKPISIYSGSYTGKPNPHAWMSPSNALIYVDNITRALIEHDPANRAYYQHNAKQYKQQLQQLKNWMQQQVQIIPPNQRYLVTSEGAFSYLARDLGFRELYLWPINSDQQGTPKQVKAVIDAVRKHNIPVIFSESTVSDKSAKQVAAEANIHYGGVLYVDSISAEDGPVPSFLKLLEVTLTTIINGFQSQL